MAAITVTAFTCDDGLAQASYTYDDGTLQATALDGRNDAPYPVWVEFTYEPTGDTRSATITSGQRWHQTVSLPLSQVALGLSGLTVATRAPA
jgi:hypothetical protein